MRGIVVTGVVTGAVNSMAGRVGQQVSTRPSPLRLPPVSVLPLPTSRPSLPSALAGSSIRQGMKALFSPPRILPPCLSGTKHLEGLSSSLSMPPPPLHVTIPQLWHDMLSGRAERLLSLLNAFFLLVYPDIKHWHFLSSLCASFPSAPPPFSCGTHAIWQGRAPPPISPFVFFLLVFPDIKHWRFLFSLYAESIEKECYVPPCALPAAAPRSNQPAPLASDHAPATSLHVLCLRQRHGRISLHHSPLLHVQIPPPPADWLDPLTAPATCPSATGWELNAKGRTGARCADLAPLMDPARLVDEAASLNLKLMRWRVLPQLQLEGLNATKCRQGIVAQPEADEAVARAATAAAGAAACNQVLAAGGWLALSRASGGLLAQDKRAGERMKHLL
ncbi:unnamed protein product [Closterium sp. NIES-65]|nr:unnamed protein product [Closterium sp. NIES-65]